MNLASDKYKRSERSSAQVSALQSGAAGAIGGVFTRAILQPFDVLKIRFQLQVEAISKIRGGLYQGLFQASKTIAKNEGISALWKAHISAQILSVTYGVGQFSTYTFLQKQFRCLGHENNGMVNSFCGGCSGFVATLVSFPFDLARTRIIAQSHLEFRGTLDVWRKELAKENFFSLYKGLSPSLLMTVPFAAIQFPFYYFLSSLMPNNTMEGIKTFGVELTKDAVCGTVAGAFAKMVVYPLDVLKKRIQIKGSESIREGFGKVVVYRNIWDCMKRVTMEEGALAWYKGFMPSVIKSGLSSGLIFGFYETSCSAILVLDTIAKDKD